jgi:hypothetical protein
MESETYRFLFTSLYRRNEQVNETARSYTKLLLDVQYLALFTRETLEYTFQHTSFMQWNSCDTFNKYILKRSLIQRC